MIVAVLAQNNKEFMEFVQEDRKDKIDITYIFVNKVSDCFGKKFNKMVRINCFYDIKVIMAVKERLITID